MDISSKKHIAQFVTAFGFQVVVFSTVIYTVVYGNWLARILLNFYAGILILLSAYMLASAAFAQYNKFKKGRKFRETSPPKQESQTAIELAGTHIGSIFSILEITIFFHYSHWDYLVLWLVAEYAQYTQRKNIAHTADSA